MNDGVFRIEPDLQTVESVRNTQILLSALRELPERSQFNFDKYTSPQSPFSLFYVVVGGRLRFSLGVLRWERMPFFSLLDFRSFDPNASAFTFRSAMNSLFAETFRSMHAEGRFTFYYVTRARPFAKKHLEKTGHLSPVRGLSIFENYDFTIEAQVPGGVKPKFEYQVKLLGFENRNVAYWIKRGTLKMPFVAEYLGRSV